MSSALGRPGSYERVRAIFAVRLYKCLASTKSGCKVVSSDKTCRRLWSKKRLTKNKREVREYCLIVEGAYLSESEAEHALRDPFIEDWVEQTGHFRIHNMNEIQIAPGVTLGSLGVVMLDDRLFEIASTDPEHPLTEHKAKGVAEALRRQDMFDEIRTEPREEELVNDGA